MIKYIEKPKKSYSKKSASNNQQGTWFFKPAKDPQKRAYYKNVGKMAGGYLGSYFGPAGSAIGSTIGNYAPDVFGWGAYNINRPKRNFTKKRAAYAAADSLPQFVGKSGDEGREVRIQHREYIGDIFSGTLSNGATLFDNNVYNINPGLSGTFPWLSQIAMNFEEYKFNGLIFEYKSMSANALNSTNTALGTIIMATQYNAAADDFASKIEMQNHEFVVSCKPSESKLAPVECAPKQTVASGHLYVRINETIPSNQDQRLYDMGSFQLATQGMQDDNVNLGELWVTYDVCLYKPKLVSSFNLGWTYYATTGISAAVPFGTNTTALEANSGNAPALSGTSLTFTAGLQPAGNYIIFYAMAGTSTASVKGPQPAFTGGCTAYDAWSQNDTNGGVLDADAMVYPNAATTSGTVTGMYFMHFSGSNGTISLSAGAPVFPASPTDMCLRIFRIPDNIEDIPNTI